MKEIKLPELEVKPNEVMLLDLFKATLPEGVSWDDVTSMDGTKVKMNDQDYTELMDKILENNPEEHRTGILMLWMNKGPSVRKESPRGKLILEEGYYETL